MVAVIRICYDVITFWTHQNKCAENYIIFIIQRSYEQKFKFNLENEFSMFGLISGLQPLVLK